MAQAKGRRKRVSKSKKSTAPLVVLAVIGAILIYAFAANDLRRHFPWLGSWISRTSPGKVDSSASEQRTDPSFGKKSSAPTAIPSPNRKSAGSDKEGTVLEADLGRNGSSGSSSKSSSADKLNSTDRKELSDLLNEVAK